MSKNKTHYEYMQEFNKSKNTKVEILGEYINAKTKILVRCNKCHNEWNADPRSILRGSGCNKCQNRVKPPIKKKKTDAQFKQEVSLLHKDITVLGIYTGSHKRVLVKCNIDGYQWNPMATSLLHKDVHGCPKCAAKAASTRNLLSQEEFMIRFEKIQNKNILVIGKYKGADNKIKCRCLKCGKDFTVIVYNLLNGAGCPYCKISKGESQICNVLDNLKISYQTQYKFENLIGLGNRQLSYDFYLPDYNLLIEYQGEFHDGSGRDYTKINLCKQQEHDKRKREFAQKHNIELLEIWYWDFDNIELILNKKLKIAS